MNLSVPGEALRQYALRELETADRQLQQPGTRLHQGVHQARKSIRRARACLALGAAGLGPGADVLDRELGRLGRGLSGLRDAQARIEALKRLESDATTSELALLRRARKGAGTARSLALRMALADDPGLASRRSLLRMLSAALAALPWQDVGLDPVQQAERESAQRRDRAASRARAQERARITDWHRWRRRARRHQQQVTALAAISLPVPDIEPRERLIAQHLGHAQDIALLLEQCEDACGLGPAEGKALRRLLERRLEQAWTGIAAMVDREPDAA